MVWVYVLWSKKLNKRYVGCTEDLQKRLREHNAGQTSFTSGGIPWVVVHTEQYPTKTDARRRENFLKGGVGRQWLDKELPLFSRAQGNQHSERCKSG